MSEQFDMLAGQLQWARERAQNFIEDLATRFERALPGQTKVVRQWRVLGGHITELDLFLGDVRYRIESHRPPSYTVTRQVITHGIAVGMAEPLPAATWIVTLCDDLARYAEHEGIAAHTLGGLLND